VVSGNKWSLTSRLGTLNFHLDFGNLITLIDYGSPPNYAEFHTNLLKIDSIIFGVAGRTQKHDGDSAYWGWFVNFSNYDSLIWDRAYHYNNSSNHFFSDLKQTTDGGYIICGFNKNDSLNVNNSWVVKLDSNACDVPDCQLLGIPQSKYIDKNEIILAPNPANDFVDINYSGAGKKVLHIYSADGKFLKEFDITANGRIFLNELANGLYLFRFFVPKNIANSTILKLIINH